jgi:hypothetical protein
MGRKRLATMGMWATILPSLAGLAGAAEMAGNDTMGKDEGAMAKDKPDPGFDAPLALAGLGLAGAALLRVRRRRP